VGGASSPEYADLRDSNVLGGLAAFSTVQLTFGIKDTPERIEGRVATGNFFDVLGVPSVVGRTFTPEDDRIGSPVRVAVLSVRPARRAMRIDPAAALRRS
jgi:hypothetical protein